MLNFRRMVLEWRAGSMNGSFSFSAQWTISAAPPRRCCRMDSASSVASMFLRVVGDRALEGAALRSIYDGLRGTSVVGLRGVLRPRLQQSLHLLGIMQAASITESSRSVGP